MAHETEKWNGQTINRFGPMDRGFNRERKAEDEEEMKRVFTGWIGRREMLNNAIYVDSTQIIVDLFERGRKDDWEDRDWPPRRVKVTVEVEGRK
jgi:hypothetical protein